MTWVWEEDDITVVVDEKGWGRGGIVDEDDDAVFCTIEILWVGVETKIESIQFHHVYGEQK